MTVDRQEEELSALSCKRMRVRASDGWTTDNYLSRQAESECFDSMKMSVFLMATLCSSYKVESSGDKAKKRPRR